MDTYEHVFSQMTDYRAPTGMPEDWGLRPKSNESTAPFAGHFTVLYYEGDGADYLMVCEEGIGARRYRLSELQIANLSEQLAKRAANLLRKKCT